MRTWAFLGAVAALIAVLLLARRDSADAAPDSETLPAGDATPPAPGGPPPGATPRRDHTQGGAARAANDARFQLDASEWDLGAVPQGVLRERTFTLSNVGTEPGQVTRVNSSCGCTVADHERLLHQTLAPGESRTFTIAVNTTGKHNPFQQRVEIETTDRARPVLVLTVRAQLREREQAAPLRVTPAAWDFGVVERGQAPRRTFLVQNDHESAIEVYAVQGALALDQPATLAPRAASPVTVTLPPQFEPGVARVTLNFLIRPAVPADLRVDVSGYVRGVRGALLRPDREALDLGVVAAPAAGRAPRWPLMLRNTGDEPAVLRQAHWARNEGERLTLGPLPTAAVPPGGEARLELALAEGAATGLLDGLLMLRTNALDHRQFTVTVTGYLAPGAAGEVAPLTRLSFLYFSDPLGVLAACDCHEQQAGGLDRLATAFARERALVPDAVTLGGGDYLALPDGAVPPIADGPAARPAAARLRSRAIAEALALMNFDVLAAGEREFAHGRAFYDAELLPRLPLLVSNERRDGPDRKPWRLSERAGVRLAVFAVLAADHPAEVARDPARAVLQRWLPAAAAESDLQLLIGHLSPPLCHQLADEFPELDLVFIAHASGLTYREPLARPRGARASYVVACSEGGRSFLRLDVYLDPARRITALKQYPRELTALYEPEPRVAAILDRYRSELATLTLPAALGSGPAFQGAESCRTCHAAEYRTWAESRHARRAFASLAERGDQHDPDCLRCHVTGLDRPHGFVDPKQQPALAAVSCEQCHGPAERHVADRQAGVETPAPPPLTPDQTLCRGCHHPQHSPAFVFDAYWRRIAHGGK